jgi:hypothetical protein
MNKTIAHLGVKAGLLNYIEHETPRHYFMSAWATEEDVTTFTELVIAECIKIMKQNESEPVGVLQAKSADIHSTVLRTHFGINK